MTAAAARARSLARGACLALVCALLGLAGPAWADDAVWSDLSPAQRSMLAPLRAHWPAMDGDEQAQWLALTASADRLPATERARLQARIGEWARLSPGQRGQARLQYQQAQQWDAGDRRARWEAYQSLHPQARQALADRWKFEAAARKSRPAEGDQDKRNVVELPSPPPAPPRTATPTTVRATKGATTQPLSRRGDAASPLQHGLPKVQASESMVDPATLLPRRGPQAAAMARTPDSAASSRPARRSR